MKRFISLTLITLTFILTPILFNSYSDSITKVAQIPIQDGGRIKPLDTVARQTLLSLQGKQSVKLNNRSLLPIEWLMLTQSSPNITDDLDIFLIENPQVFSFVDDKYYKQKYRVSFNFLIQYQDYILGQATQAEQLKSKQRSPLQQEFVTLKQRLFLYSRLKNTIGFEQSNSLSSDLKSFLSINPSILKTINVDQPNKDLILLNMFFKQFKIAADNSLYSIIPSQDHQPNSDWDSYGNAVLKSLAPELPVHPLVYSLSYIHDNYDLNNDTNILLPATEIHNYYLTHNSSLLRKVKLEYSFNKLELFFKSYLLYLICLFMVLIYWIYKKTWLLKDVQNLFLITTVIFTVAILIRMFLQGRPPVTNLYSSALFVGYIAVLIAYFIERIEKNGIGIFIGSIIGFLSLIVAHFLSLGGDTLEMMQAVLDSNFWLSTHVIIITMGYSAVFLAGLLAHIYIVGGFLTTKLSKSLAKRLSTLTYGTIGAALLLSFIGTVLGGIWGDQSWGRFWGWDPKENGAMLIVIWMALILHARLGGLIKQRGIMVMAVFGNIVCSFSWFGVNLLGIGLHSYGFTEKGFYWLIMFWASQVFVIILGLIPTRIWASFQDPKSTLDH